MISICHEDFCSIYLFFSAYKGHEKLLKYLIESNADINAKNQDDDTPLHYAAAGDQSKAIKLLITAGANINQQNKFLATPLIYCGYNGKYLKLIKTSFSN